VSSVFTQQRSSLVERQSANETKPEIMPPFIDFQGGVVTSGV